MAVWNNQRVTSMAKPLIEVYFSSIDGPIVYPHVCHFKRNAMVIWHSPLFGTPFLFNPHVLMDKANFL